LQHVALIQIEGAAVCRRNCFVQCFVCTHQPGWSIIVEVGKRSFFKFGSSTLVDRNKSGWESRANLMDFRGHYRLLAVLANRLPAPLCAVSNEYRAASDQNYAEPIWQRKPFAQKEHREN
jgi:hypothetical protein